MAPNHMALPASDRQLELLDFIQRAAFKYFLDFTNPLNGLVAGIEFAIESVRKLGGQTGRPGAEDEGFGRFVECRDNQGVRFGLRQMLCD